MTIRARLAFALTAILLLFAVNLSIHFWSDQRRNSTVEGLRKAIDRQMLIGSINQNLNDLQKQIALLSQVLGEEKTGGPNTAENADVFRRMDNIKQQLQDFEALSDSSARNQVASLLSDYTELSASWRKVYGNFGVNQTTALVELVTKAEPLSQRVILQSVPQLQEDERHRVEQASSNFYAVARLTNRMTIAIFLLSAVLAIGVAYVVSRHLTLGLRVLNEGATHIGAGDLDHRIVHPVQDELGDLARAFNEMTERLGAARNELRVAHETERRKGAQLQKALDDLSRAQDQLIVQQKLASLGTLTAGIAHEIKNPLNFVTNFSVISVGLVDELKHLLAEQKDKIDSNQVPEISDILSDLETNAIKIREHGKRADSIVRNMLMHSRGQSTDLQPTNINSLLSEYVKLAYHGMRAQDSGFNVTIEENYDPSIPSINVVSHDLSRVFLNIVNNACYAVNDKRKRTGNAFTPTVSISSKNLGNKVEIRIRDNGDGIPREIQRKIFEPFFTTKPAGTGTGLGLSMSYDIIVEHKGELRVESEEGRYSEFIITLPAEN